MTLRTHQRLGLIAFVLAAAILASTAPTAARSHLHHPVQRIYTIHQVRENRYLGDYFGIGTYIAKRYPGQVGPAMYRLRSTGADWIREEFTASDIHHHTLAPYHFATYDRVVSRERRNGLNLLGLLDYNNTFQGLDHTWMPHRHIQQYIADFDAFVTATVQHYRHQIFYWQIWNEPDLAEFWHPFPFASDYAHLLTSAYSIIKRINPQAKVVIAGPSVRDQRGIPFLRKVVAAGAKFDIVSIQPYENYPNYELIDLIRGMRAFHKPIWFSEAGWAGQTSCVPCGEPLMQARKLTTLFFISGIEGISKVFWYDFRDDGVGTGIQDHFGLVEWNFRAKAAYRAFEIGLRLLNRAYLVATARINGAISLYKIRHGSKRYYALWNNSPHWSAPPLHWHRSPVRVLDALGQQIGISRNHVIHLGMPPDSVQYFVGYHTSVPRFAPRGLPIPPGHTR